ncbi:hypothetical protein PSPO01_12841 [Paraphaeosphaeria sporulosa]
MSEARLEVEAVSARVPPVNKEGPWVRDVLAATSSVLHLPETLAWMQGGGGAVKIRNVQPSVFREKGYKVFSFAKLHKIGKRP